MRRPGSGQIGRAALVGALLLLHCHTRLATHLSTPPSEKHYWPSSYLVALSILAGQGFAYVLPSAADGNASVLSEVNRLRAAPPPVGPVMDFLSGTGRQALSRQEFDAYFASDVRRVPIDVLGKGPMQSLWETTRILELRIAALVWGLFGIGWPVLFGLYALVSTFTSLLVFLIVRRLTGSYWGGLVGLVGFLASPLERLAAAWSIRDTNPVWFTGLALFLLVFLATPRGAGPRAWIGWWLLGGGTVLGLGWRSDAQLLPPFILLGLVVLLVLEGATWRRILQATVICAAGGLTTLAAISWMGPGARGHGGGVVFHIAWYGEHVRSIVLGTENAFQIKQDDYLTLYQANYFRQQRDAGASPVRDIYDPRHFRTIRQMYFVLARYNAYAWWRSYPGYLWEAARIDRAIQPGPAGGGSDVSSDRGSLAAFVAGVRPIEDHVLKPYIAGIPYWAAGGLAVGLARARSRRVTLLLAAYFAYYAAALLMVLPESKHWAPLLIPLHILAAVGLWNALTAVAWRRPPRGREWTKTARTAVVAFVLVLASWWALGRVAELSSRTLRRQLVREILSLVPSGQDASASIRGPVFQVVPPAEAGDGPVGYLLRLRGARRPLNVFAVHARDATLAGSTPLYYYTRHVLPAGREQHFFVNAVAGRRIGDDRPYTLYVRVRGRAEIVSATRLDLSRWHTGLPLSLLFEEGDEKPGSDPIDKTAPVTDEFGSAAEVLAFVAPRR